MTLDDASQISSNSTLGTRFFMRDGYKRPTGVLVELHSQIGEHFPRTSSCEDTARETTEH